MKTDNKQQSLNQIMDHRIKKMNDLIEKDINPYPYRFKRSHIIAEIVENKKKLINTNVSIAGRVVSARRMGKVTFFNIQDKDSKIQLFVKSNNLKDEIYNNIVRKIDIGDIVGTSGELFYTKTNELSVNSDVFEILCKSIRPMPNLKEKDGKTFFSFDDKELRYRKRHLDLIANFEVKDIFTKRAKIIKSIRDYLDGLDFLEVETPVLQPLYGGANARPFKTFHNTLNENLYLRIATELYLKRLIIGGIEKVYEIGKDFRNEGMDRNHNPEFTMLEFYEAYSDLSDMISLTENLIKHSVSIISKDMIISFNNEKINFNKNFKSFDFFKILKDKSKKEFMQMSDAEIYQFLNSKDILGEWDPVNKLNRGKLLDKAFSHYVEPYLIQPTFIINYPIEISPLAKKSKKNESIVERFELFIGGMEIANAFSELNDPIDQKARLEKQSVLRELGDDEAQTLDLDFIEAIEYGMPPTGGVGLGIDRLVMLLLSQSSIKDVILFPAMRSEE